MAIKASKKTSMAKASPKRTVTSQIRTPKKTKKEEKNITAKSSKEKAASRKTQNSFAARQVVSTFISSLNRFKGVKSSSNILDKNPKNIGVSFLRKISLNKKILIPVLLVGFGLLGLYLASRYLVVAWVNNKPITKLELYSNLDKKYGQDQREQLIVERLVNDESIQRGVTANEDEIQKEIKKIQEEQGGQEQLDQILSLQGISQDEFRNLVRLQILKQKMFGSDVKVTDEEVNKFISDNKDQFTENSDKQFQEVKLQLTQQKVNTNFNNWLKDALQSERVIRL